MTKRTLFTLALIFSAASVFARQPQWVLFPYATYPAENYIAAVGEDSVKEIAQQKAVNQFAGVFGLSVKSSSLTSLSFRGNPEKSLNERKSLNQDILLKTQVDDLVTVDFPESFYDKKSETWFVLAVLDKKKACAIYTQEILQNENVINKTLSECEGKNFDEISKLQSALELSKINEKLNSRLVILESKAFSDLKSVAEIQKEIQRIAQKFPIFIDIENGKKLEPIIKSALVEKFYQISESPSARIKCMGKAEFNFTNADSFVLCQINLTFQLQDSQLGKVYMPFSVSAREGAGSEEKAKLRAEEILKEKIENLNL